MLCFVMFCYVAGNVCLKQGIVLDRSHVRDTNRRDVLVANSCDAAFGSVEEQMKELN